MPSYIVTDRETGKRLKLTGDSAPTESELESVFEQYRKQPDPAAERRRELQSQTPFAGAMFPEEFQGPSLEPTALGAPAISSLPLPKESQRTIKRMQLAMSDPQGLYQDNPLDPTGLKIPKQTDPTSLAEKVGVNPENVPTGQEYQEFYGLPDAARLPLTTGSAMLKMGAGVADYATSPQGILEGAAAISPVAPAVYVKWAYDMLHGAYGSASDGIEAMKDKLKEEAMTVLAKRVAGAEDSGLMDSAKRIISDPEFTQRMAENGVNTIVGAVAGGKAGVHGIKSGVRAATNPFQEVRINPELRRQLQDFTDPTLLEAMGIEKAAIEALRLPPRAQPEPMLPELQRTKELMDLAVRQNSPGYVMKPGEQSAIELLKAQGVEVAPREIATAERIQGGGEAPYGKVSFMREAEAPTTRGAQEAVQREKAQSEALPADLKAKSAEASRKTAENLRRELEAQGVKTTSENAQPSETPPTASRPQLVEGTPKAGEGVYSFGENDVQVGKPSVERKTRPNGTDITTRIEVNAPLEITRSENWSAINPDHTRYVVEASGKFEERTPAKKNEPVWRVWNPKTKEFIATGMTQAEAILKAKSEMVGNNFGNKKSPLERADAALGELQKKIRGDSKNVQMGIPKAILDLSIEVARVSLRATNSVVKAIEAAIEYIKREHPTAKFNRDELAQWISENIETKVPPTAGESVRMRQSAERATESPMIPKPVQERISEAPESFYKQQSGDKVENVVKGLSDSELGAVPADSNLFVASRIELADRLFRQGKMDEGYNVFVELEKQGTSFGQNINQFKRLPGTLPEHVAFAISEKLKKAGKDPLTKPQQERVIEISRKSKQADMELEAATDRWVREPTDANAKLAESALDNANNAALELQRFVSRFEPRSTSSVLKSVLQGNLLTPISEVANLVGNMSFLPFRAGTRSVASGLDILSNAITKRQRTISTSPVGGTVEAAKGIARGLSQVPQILLKGTGDTIKGETRAGLHPVRAWVNQFAKNPEMPTTKGKLTLKDRVNLAIEGTFGVPAEAMLRGLGAGDAPFREAARARVIAEQLRLNKIPKDKWGMAQRFPELFFDRETMSQIQRDTMAAIFQRESKTLNVMTNWLRGKGDLMDFAVATVAPYKLTPWNIIGEILSYNPLVAFGRTVYESNKGNQRAARMNAGKFVVGTMLTAAGYWLYDKGLLAPSLDERTEAQKARILSGEVLPPNHINISGLERALTGGDPTFKGGDKTVDIFRSGGLAGSMFYMAANVGRDLEKQPESGTMDTLAALITQSTLEQARFGLNQSFLSGVEGFLTAVKDGNTDSYARQWLNTVSSIPLPNSLATLSRATREYKPDFKADGFFKQAENTVRNKLGFAGLDEYLPLKRGLWGEPLPETPKDRNALLYHFFDVSKGRQVTDDPVPLELYRLWRTTGDTRAIPSLPSKDFTADSVTYTLTPEQLSRLAELVGKERRKIVDGHMVNPNFFKMSDEDKLDFLDMAYREGLRDGKDLFLDEYEGKLTPKGKKAGFKIDAQ